MLINEEIKLDYSDVLIRPKRSTMGSRGEVCLSRTHKFLWSTKEWTGIPVMSANMDTVGTPSMHKVLSDHKMITCPARHFLRDGVEKFKDGNNHVCWFGGIDEISHLSTVSSAFIGLDVANGYTIRFVDAVKKLREKCPNATIAAGNVVTADMTQELILAGGDIVKAFAGGADFVMIGGMLAGHDECEGVVENGVMEFYGMASESAMNKHNNHNSYRGAEGKTVKIPHRGKADDTVKDILSGIRSACTYVGANSLRTLSKCTTFVRVNNTHNTIYEH